MVRCGLPVLCAGLLTGADAQTLNARSATLSAKQRASLQRFLTESKPALTFDWTSLVASSNSIGRERQPLTVSLTTLPALTAAKVCRSEQHSFSLEHGSRRWRANEALTRLYAWMPSGAECAGASSPISVNKAVSDAEFLFLARQQDALRSRAAGVIGGSDCARVRYCEVTLRQLHRERQETPPRTLTKLIFFPSKPGPDCLYVMEVSFVGPLEELVPLGASCPKP